MLFFKEMQYLTIQKCHFFYKFLFFEQKFRKRTIQFKEFPNEKVMPGQARHDRWVWGVTETLAAR
jgi:hypothetical protein